VTLPVPVSASPTEIDEERQFPHLTPLQEAFVINYVANGGNGTRAAKAAGYEKTSAHVRSSQLLRKPAICEAVLVLTRAMQASHAPAALATVAMLMKRSKSDYVRLEAAKDIQARLGLQAPTRVHHTGGVSINIDLGE
jgi:phage terminase small subunit